MKDVEFMEADQVDQLQHKILREEMAGHVEVHASPGKARAVFDLDAVHRYGPHATHAARHRGRRDRRGAKQVWREQLP